MYVLNAGSISRFPGQGSDRQNGFVSILEPHRSLPVFKGRGTAKLRLASFCKSKPRSPGKLKKSNLELVWRACSRAPATSVLQEVRMPTSVRKFCESAIIFCCSSCLSSVSSAQTQIDLSSQSRNVDFSGARRIRFPTGTLFADMHAWSGFLQNSTPRQVNIYPYSRSGTSANTTGSCVIVRHVGQHHGNTVKSNRPEYCAIRKSR